MLVEAELKGPLEGHLGIDCVHGWNGGAVESHFKPFADGIQPLAMAATEEAGR